MPLVFFIAVNRFYPDDGLFRAAEFVSRVGFVVFVPCALSLMFLGGVAGFGIGWNVVRKLEQVQHWTRAKGAMLGAAAICIPSLEMFLFFLLAPVGSSLRSDVLIGFAAITISISGAILGASWWNSSRNSASDHQPKIDELPDDILAPAGCGFARVGPRCSGRRLRLDDRTIDGRGPVLVVD